MKKEQEKNECTVFFIGEIKPVKISKEGGKGLKEELLKNNSKFIGIKGNVYKTTIISAVI